MAGYEIWERIASKYDKLWVQKYSLGPTRKKVIAFIRGLHQETDDFKILDIGCGIGQLAQEITDYFKVAQYTGIDVSKKMIEKALERNRKERIILMNKAVEEMDERIGKFDVVICTHAFPYFPNKLQVIKRVYDMLTEGGVFILANASENNFYDKIIFFFLKFTTSKAEYLSKTKIGSMLRNGNFKNINIANIKEKTYMPTICFITSKKGNTIHEDFINQT